MSCIDTINNATSYECAVWANPTVARPCATDDNPEVAAKTGENCGDNDIGNPYCDTCTRDGDPVGTQNNIARGSRYYYNACNPNAPSNLYPDYTVGQNRVYDDCAATCATYGFNINDDRASKCAGLKIYRGTFTPIKSQLHYYGAHIDSWINQEGQVDGPIKVFFVPKEPNSRSGRLRINVNGVQVNSSVAWSEYYSRGDREDIMITTNDQGTGTHTESIPPFSAILTARMTRNANADTYSLNLTDDTLDSDYNLTLNAYSTVPDPSLPPPPPPPPCNPECLEWAQEEDWSGICARYSSCRGCPRCISPPPPTPPQCNPNCRERGEEIGWDTICGRGFNSDCGGCQECDRYRPQPNSHQYRNPNAPPNLQTYCNLNTMSEQFYEKCGHEYVGPGGTITIPENGPYACDDANCAQFRREWWPRCVANDRGDISDNTVLGGIYNEMQQLSVYNDPNAPRDARDELNRIATMVNSCKSGGN